MNVQLKDQTLNNVIMSQCSYSCISKILKIRKLLVINNNKTYKFDSLIN